MSSVHFKKESWLVIEGLLFFCRFEGLQCKKELFGSMYVWRPGRFQVSRLLGLRRLAGHISGNAGHAKRRETL